MAMLFRHPHGLNVAGESIRSYFETLRPEIMLEKDAYAKSVNIMQQKFSRAVRVKHHEISIGTGHH